MALVSIHRSSKKFFYVISDVISNSQLLKISVEYHIVEQIGAAASHEEKIKH
jgi:hypothetical protein